MALAGNVLPANLSDFDGGAHAWTAGANTTLALSTLTTLTAPNSLRATPTAAGSVNLTSARFAVTPGTDYECSVPVRTSASAAGRTATASVTWYSAMSGGSSLGTMTKTVPLVTTAGWFSANNPVAIGMAPAGAVAATITLSVAGLAAGEFVYTDRIEFAPTVLLAGNLLSYQAQSLEADMTDWTVSGPASLVRYGGFMTSGTGSYMMAADSTGTGTVTIETAAKVPVSAGTEYRGSMFVYSSALGTSFSLTISIRWYSAADVLLGSSSYTNSMAGTTVAPAVVVGTAPAGATKATLALSHATTASGQVVQYDQAWLCVAPNLTGNLLGYTQFSQETSVDHWTLEGATGLTRAYFTSTYGDDYYAARISPTGASQITMSMGPLVPVTPGQYYESRVVLSRHSTGGAETVSHAYSTTIDWYDAGSALLEVGIPDPVVPVSSSSAYYGGYSSGTHMAPEGAAFARLIVRISHMSPLVDFYYVDCTSVRASDPEYTLAVDDATGSVTLNLLYVPEAGMGTTAVSVRRMDQDGNAYYLRSYAGETDHLPYVPGPMVFEDYEAPLATRIWYRVDFHGTTHIWLATRLVDSPIIDDPDYVWLKSPGMPALNTRVSMEAPLAWTRTARSTRYDIVGRRNPVHVASERSGRQTTISLLIWDESSHVIFDSLLDSGQPVLLQAMPGYGVNGNLYLSLADSSAEPLDSDAREDGWRWTLAVTEIDRPTGGLSGSALRTWQDVYDANATWDDVFAAATWSDVLMGG